MALEPARKRAHQITPTLEDQAGVERLPEGQVAAVGLGAVSAALLGGTCFSATRSAFRPLGRAHPYSLLTNFRREGLLPAFLNFCAQVPNTGFSAFLPWALGRGVGNPGILFLGSQVGAAASRLLAGRLADRHGSRMVLAPAMVGVAAALIGMSVAVGLPAFFILAIGYGALFGVAFVVLPALVGEAAPAEGRGADDEHLRSRGGHGAAFGTVGTRPCRRDLLRRGAGRGRRGAPARRSRVSGAVAGYLLLGSSSPFTYLTPHCRHQ